MAKLNRVSRAAHRPPPPVPDRSPYHPTLRLVPVSRSEPSLDLHRIARRPLRSYDNAKGAPTRPRPVLVARMWPARVGGAPLELASRRALSVAPCA